MTDDAGRADPAGFPDYTGFDGVFRAEACEINKRREATGRPLVPDASSAVPDANNGLVGLSLSGGGIRSAAFSLGALQALEAMGQIRNIDYVSSVSGGAYVGGSVTLGMSLAKGEFPFPSELGRPENTNLKNLRDFSNYLLVGGLKSTLQSFANIVAGFASNTLAVLPILFLAAAITIYLNPTRQSLLISVWNEAHGYFVMLGSVILYAAGLGLVALVLLARLWERNRATRTGLRTTWLVILAIPVAFAFFELQPAAIQWLWDKLDESGGPGAETDFAAGLGALAAALTTFSAAIGRFLGSPNTRTGWTRILIPIRKALLYFAAGVVIPLLLWVTYLGLTMWGTIEGSRDVREACVQEWQNAGPQPTFDAFGGPPSVDKLLCRILAPGADEVQDLIRPGTDDDNVGSNGVWWLFLAIAGVLFATWLVIPPNAYSLHYLYRDRIAKAFLYYWTRPTEPRPPDVEDRQTTFPLTAIDPAYAPYPIINAALNIHGSRLANQRGRNAEFFIFTPRYVGCELTKYRATSEMERTTPSLNLAAAITISGAAASASVGAKVSRLFVFSLAMLNIRLGFWLPNPGRPAKALSRTWGPAWFLYEAFGRLDETSSLSYLSDGGHIENLGLYELLRRHASIIIVVDAEADPHMIMPSFVEAQRFARIDLGIRIDLEWDLVCEGSKAFDPQKPKKGPHAAMGLIRYGEASEAPPDGELGILIYVKASVSGDENDYVREYRRRYPAFPHESTLDQFFSEEQFEAYRALGFHAVQRLFSGEDLCQGLSDDRALLARTAERIFRRDLGDLPPIRLTDRTMIAQGKEKVGD